ncbi:MAG: hypothetical protein H7A23_10365 [Leptospiraceae bacterium]|nr:hypothetical protein [Leptospiraceae bacterium]MCP5494947.1 hypothetical protein [Leptospiraceae bacterium]
MVEWQIAIFSMLLMTGYASMIAYMIFFFHRQDREWQVSHKTSILELHRMRDKNHRDAISFLKAIHKTNRDNSVYLRMILEKVETKKGYGNEEDGDYA